MSDPVDKMSDRDGLAAEYVIGTLPLAERIAAEKLIASDPEFAALVDHWQAHFAPLNAEFAEVAPPDAILGKIEARLFPTPAKAKPFRLPFFGAFAAVAALVVLVAFWPFATTTPTLQTTLTGDGQQLVVAASFDGAAKTLTFTRSAGPTADAGKDYEVWIIPAGQAAVSLGVLRDAELKVPVDALPPGTTLAITLEQTGGSPTGVAQGPLLVASMING